MPASESKRHNQVLPLLAANVILGVTGLTLAAVSIVAFASNDPASGLKLLFFAITCIIAALSVYKALVWIPKETTPDVNYNDTNAKTTEWAREHYPEAFAKPYTDEMLNSDLDAYRKVGRRGPAAIATIVWISVAAMVVTVMAVVFALHGQAAVFLLLLGVAAAYVAGAILVARAIKRGFVELMRANARMRVQLGANFDTTVRNLAKTNR